MIVLVVCNWPNASQILEPEQDHYSREVLPANRQNAPTIFPTTANVDQHKGATTNIAHIERIGLRDCLTHPTHPIFGRPTTTFSNIWIDFIRRNA